MYMPPNHMMSVGIIFCERARNVSQGKKLSKVKSLIYSTQQRWMKVQTSLNDGKFHQRQSSEEFVYALS